MNGLLAMLLYLNHKCATDNRLRKTFLVLTLIFVFMLWSPWTRWNCPVFGLCPGPSPAVSTNSAAQSKSKPHRVKGRPRAAPTPAAVQTPAESFSRTAVPPVLVGGDLKRD
jgi:hypothetical protein